MRLRTAGVLAGVLLLASAALAHGPADSFRRSIRLFTRAIPAFASDAQATGWYRRFHVDQIRRAEDGTWPLHAVVFLAAPLEDFEVQLVFHDVSDGPHRFVHTTSAMVGDRNARVVKKHLVLREPDFRPRRWYQVVATRRRAEVTRPLRFFLGGTVDRGPQEVTFSEDEAETGTGPPDLDL